MEITRVSSQTYGASPWLGGALHQGCGLPLKEPTLWAASQQYRCYQRQYGGALIELTMALPVLLILLSAVMYFAHLMSARAAIVTAVNSVRIAATRANSPISTEVFREIESFHATGNASQRLKSLLASKDLEDAAFSTSGRDSYNDFLKDASQFPAPAPELMGLEKEDLISMVYSIGIVRQSLGEHVKTPCQEPGCLLCLPIPPPWADVSPGQTSTLTTKPARARFAGIRCEYIPDGFIFNMINSLLRLLDPNGGDLSPITFRQQRSVIFDGWGEQG
ncbi:pilus assembly protein [bacterium]|nr:pilus assembly protein [bacterium]